MADLTGQTLGNYRIEGPLGSGGMGDVYRAMHVHLNRPAAIKVLHANQAADPTFQARFLREARAAAALSHPNIVEVFDFGQQDGDSYLVMELIPDGSLRTLLKQRSVQQGWTLGMGVDLVRQAAEGLAYAHAQGMVHRDIKPDNLLLQRLPWLGKADDAEAGEHYQIKISDFGLARLVDDTGELTATGMVMGTPTYMSPEQCQGSDLDGRSDLYSLGVVLYEVATGAPPFRVKTLSEAVFKHISTPPVPPRELHPELPVALEDAIMRCLQKQPEERFDNATELAEALDGALGETEMRTVVTVRGTDGATTSTPASRAQSGTPIRPNRTSDSLPSASALPLSAHTVSATPPDQVARSNDPTLRASAVEMRPSAGQRQASSGAARGSNEWPQPDGNGPRNRQPQSRVLVIGAVALLLVVALVVGAMTAAAHFLNGTAKATATVPPTVVPTATATPVDTVRFSDSLAKPSSKWPNYGHSYFSNGGYEINGAWIVFAPTASLSDSTVSVTMRQLSGPKDSFYGVLLRGVSNSHYYLFGIDGNQQWTFSLVTNSNGKPLINATTDTHIKTDGSNTITVRAVGHHFVFYINGAQVGEADDSAIASGQVGLINTVGNLQVVYNNFTVAVPK